MKKLLLLLVCVVSVAHGIRPLAEASQRFQTALNSYVQNKNSNTAQAVLDEYSSRENTDKYRRTFDSTLKTKNISIAQIQADAAVPAQDTFVTARSGRIGIVDEQEPEELFTDRPFMAGQSRSVLPTPKSTQDVVRQSQTTKIDPVERLSTGQVEGEATRAPDIQEIKYETKSPSSLPAPTSTQDVISQSKTIYPAQGASTGRVEGKATRTEEAIDPEVEQLQKDLIAKTKAAQQNWSALNTTQHASFMNELAAQSAKADTILARLKQTNRQPTKQIELIEKAKNFIANNLQIASEYMSEQSVRLIDSLDKATKPTREAVTKHFNDLRAKAAELQNEAVRASEPRRTQIATWVKEQQDALGKYMASVGKDLGDQLKESAKVLKEDFNALGKYMASVGEDLGDQLKEPKKALQEALSAGLQQAEAAVPQTVKDKLPQGYQGPNDDQDEAEGKAILAELDTFEEELNEMEAQFTLLQGPDELLVGQAAQEDETIKEAAQEVEKAAQALEQAENATDESAVEEKIAQHIEQQGILANGLFFLSDSMIQNLNGKDLEQLAKDTKAGAIAAGIPALAVMQALGVLEVLYPETAHVYKSAIKNFTALQAVVIKQKLAEAAQEVNTRINELHNKLAEYLINLNMQQKNYAQSVAQLKSNLYKYRLGTIQRWINENSKKLSVEIDKTQQLLKKSRLSNQLRKILASKVSTLKEKQANLFKPTFQEYIEQLKQSNTKFKKKNVQMIKNLEARIAEQQQNKQALQEMLKGKGTTLATAFDELLPQAKDALLTELKKAQQSLSAAQQSLISETIPSIQAQISTQLSRLAETAQWQKIKTKAQAQELITQAQQKMGELQKTIQQKDVAFAKKTIAQLETLSTKLKDAKITQQMAKNLQTFMSLIKRGVK